MKSLKQIAAITIFGALAGAGLHAQTVALKATIPFDFSAAGTLMPAGIYEVQGQGTLMMVRRVDKGKPANAFVQTTYGNHGADRTSNPKLSFHRVGGEYFLAAISDPALGVARNVPPTVHEKEIAKRLGSVVEATVMASKK